MFFHSQGLRLAYDDQGSGPPLVFLHAFPLNRTMWAPQSPCYRATLEPSRSISVAMANRMLRCGISRSSSMPTMCLHCLTISPCHRPYW